MYIIIRKFERIHRSINSHIIESTETRAGLPKVERMAERTMEELKRWSSGVAFH